jgi:hypothetical protein
MDGHRFDHLARTLRSRRGVLAAMLAGGLAGGLARPAAAEAPICMPNGERCDPATPEECCTATCKKHNGKFKCAPAGQAYGCGKSKATDVCKGGGPLACPDNLAGVCVVARTMRKKRPLCVLPGNICAECSSDDDCVAESGNPTARCLKKCSACASSSANTICVIPA